MVTSAGGAPFLLILLVASSATAADVTFRVVSPDGAPSVSVNGGSPQPMTRSAVASAGAAGTWPVAVAGAPYYTATVAGAPDGGFKYKYAVGPAAEGFDRDFPPGGGTRQTQNDFYGRQATVSKLPNLPLAFGDAWPRTWGLTPAFDDSYIPTIYLSGDQAQIDAVLAAAPAATATVTMLAVFKDEALAYPDTTFKMTGLGRKTVYAKRDFKLELAQKVNLYGRDDWILRSTETDPTALREATYSALLAAAGLPAPRMNHVRVYANQTPLGLYLFADDTTSKSFLRAELHGQPDFKSYSALGSLVQGEDPFYFIYNGPRREDYPEVSVHYLGGNPIANALQSFIARWIEPLSLLAPGDEAGLEKNLAPNVDIDLLLKTVAVEWLAGYMRGAWGASDSFVLYEDPVRLRWLYISSDPRESLGVGYTSDVLPLSSISASFAAYQANKPRPVVQKIISNQKYLDQLAGYVSALVQRVFNEPFLVARVRAHAERVRPEVEWDRSLARLSPGLASPYNATDFEPGLTAAAERLAVNASVPGVGFGLLTFIQQRSAAVAALFQVQPDTSLSGPDPVVAPPTDDQRKDTSLRFSAAAPRAAFSAAQTVAACAAVLALQVLAAHRRR